MCWTNILRPSPFPPPISDFIPFYLLSQLQFSFLHFVVFTHVPFSLLISLPEFISQFVFLFSPFFLSPSIFYFLIPLHSADFSISSSILNLRNHPFAARPHPRPAPALLLTLACYSSPPPPHIFPDIHIYTLNSSFAFSCFSSLLLVLPFPPWYQYFMRE